MLTLAILGDVLLGRDGNGAVERFGPERCRRSMAEASGPADLMLFNLESPLTDEDTGRRDKRFVFRASSRTAEIFDPTWVAGLANNHVMDHGRCGLERTLAVLDARGIPHAGAGSCLEQAIRPAVLLAGGMRVGFLCAADPRFDPASEDSPGTFPARPELLSVALRRLTPEVDLTVVSLHMGFEYTSVPTPHMRRLADLCLAMGARVVCFHHAHRVSGVSRRGEGIVFWGLGNFWFHPGRGGAGTGHGPAAAWSVDLELENQAVSDWRVIPLALDTQGAPARAKGREAGSLTAKVGRWCRWMDRPGWTLFPVLGSVLRRDFLAASLGNYLDMARRNGIQAVFRSILSTLSLQFGRGGG